VTGPSRTSRPLARRLNAIYVASFVAAASAVTLAAFALGRALPDQLRLPPAVAGGVLLVLAGCDLRLGGLRTPSLRRQTNPAWRHRFGLARATALWGLDIGTTLTTVKMTSLYWAAFVLLFTAPGPRLHLVVGLFAAGYLATHAVVVWRVAHGTGVDSAVARVNDLVAPARVASGLLLTGVGVMLLAQAILG
jgi:hypothetical protein